MADLPRISTDDSIATNIGERVEGRTKALQNVNYISWIVDD